MSDTNPVPPGNAADSRSRSHDGDGVHAPASGAFAAVNRWLDGIAWLCMLIAGLGLVAIVLSFGWLVYGRYVLNNTPTWIEQMALLLILYIVCLGSAAGVRRHTHLSIDFVRDGLPRWPRAILHVLADAMVLTFGGVMAWEGWVLAETNANHALPMLGITAAWRAIPLAICGVLMMVFTAFDFIERLFGPKREAH